MKINGWKRIGIIASVIWVIGAGMFTLNVLGKKASDSYAFWYGECMKVRDDAAQSARERCSKQLDESACNDIYDKEHPDNCAATTPDAYRPEVVSAQWTAAAVVGFLPIPFAWGFVYLAVFLVRWVKRGFTGARP
jgi:hypothetical protein